MISIIIPTYNKAPFLEETLNSILEQTYHDWEAIIVDDCSSDNSIELIQQYISMDNRFKLIQNLCNSGGSYSRNRGLEIAKGDYLIFLDSDDLLEMNCLQDRFNEIVKSEHNLIIFPMNTFYKKIGDSIKQWIPNPRHKHLEKFLCHNLPWQTMQPIWSKQLLIDLKGFDEDYPRLQDVELHTRALLHPHTKYKISDKTTSDCYYRIDNNRLTSDLDTFMLKWCQGACLYIQKIAAIMTKQSQAQLIRYLCGTYFATLNQILYKSATGQISQDSRHQLLTHLQTTENCLNLSNLKKAIISFYKLGYYVHLYKIKGYNFTFKKLINI